MNSFFDEFLQSLASRNIVLANVIERSLLYAGHTITKDNEALKEEKLVKKMIKQLQRYKTSTHLDVFRDIRVFKSPKHSQRFWDFFMYQIQILPDDTTVSTFIDTFEKERERILSDATEYNQGKLEVINFLLPKLIFLDRTESRYEAKRKLSKRATEKSKEELVGLYKETTQVLEELQKKVEDINIKMEELETLRKQHARKLYQTEEDRTIARNAENEQRKLYKSKEKLTEQIKEKKTQVTKLQKDVLARTEFDKLSCQMCKKQSNKPLLCGHCLNVMYCSSECADVHWPNHNKE